MFIDKIKTSPKHTNQETGLSLMQQAIV